MSSIDRGLVRGLNHASQHQPFRAFAVLAAKYLAVVPPVLLVALVLWALWNRDALTAARGALAGGATLLAVAANQVVGQIVQRTRPYTAMASVHAIGSRGGDSSFYSDHTALAMGAAVGVVLLSRRIGLLALVVGALVAVGRVAVGAHYPTDVLAAAAVATAAVLVSQVAARPVANVVERFRPPVPAPSPAPSAAAPPLR